jgi:adenosylhomocysteine nucleosidase
MVPCERLLLTVQFMAKTIVMVAAEAREFHGLLNRVPARNLQWGLQFACETELNGDRTILVADGAGMQRAGAAADVARRHVRPDVVVSVGFCGAIDPDLALNDMFVASGVIDRENKKRYPAAQTPVSKSPSAAGDILSVDRVANTAAEKRELRATGARAVEMEAAAVASRAEIWNVPFYCIRSVSDTAGESFEIDFNLMRDGQGRFSRGRIALSALARPWSRIPALVRLDGNCRGASKSLGDFLANCRF